MKSQLSLAFAFACHVYAASAFAADKAPADTLTPQQQQMGDCNKQATRQDLRATNTRPT